MIITERILINTKLGNEALALLFGKKQTEKKSGNRHIEKPEITTFNPWKLFLSITLLLVASFIIAAISYCWFKPALFAITGVLSGIWLAIIAVLEYFEKRAIYILPDKTG